MLEPPRNIPCFLSAAIFFASALLLQTPQAEADTELPPLPTLRPGNKLSLKGVVKLADTQNRTLRVSRVAIKSAEAKLKATRAPLFPNLYGTLTYLLHDHAEKVQQGGATLETRRRHELSAGVEAQTMLLDASRYKHIKVSREERDLARLEHEELRQTLLYAVAEAYFQAAALQRLMRVYENQSNALKLHLETAKARYRSGVGALVDVKRAETDLLAIREEQIRAHYAHEKSRDILALLCGADKPPLPEDEPSSVTSSSTVEIEASEPFLSKRWDLKIAQKRISRQGQRLELQRMQFVPSLSAFWQFDLAVTTPDIPSDFDRTRWTAGALLTVPLFDYTFFPNLDIERAALEQTRFEMEETEAAARSELSQTRWSVAEARELVFTAEKKARLAGETLELAQTNYVNGTGSALTVIDAGRSSQTAHVDLETRRLELELAGLANLQARGESIENILE